MLVFGFEMFLEAVAALSSDLGSPPILYMPPQFNTASLNAAPAQYI